MSLPPWLPQARSSSRMSAGSRASSSTPTAGQDSHLPRLGGGRRSRTSLEAGGAGGGATHSSGLAKPPRSFRSPFDTSGVDVAALSHDPMPPSGQPSFGSQQSSRYYNMLSTGDASGAGGGASAAGSRSGYAAGEARRQARHSATGGRTSRDAKRHPSPAHASSSPSSSVMVAGPATGHSSGSASDPAVSSRRRLVITPVK